MPFLFLFIMSFSFSRKFLLPFKRKQKKMLLYKDWIHSMSHILYSAAFKYQKLHDLVAYIYGNHGSEDEALLGHRSQTLGSGVLVDVWSCGKALKALGRPRRSQGDQDSFRLQQGHPRTQRVMGEKDRCSCDPSRG